MNPTTRDVARRLTLTALALLMALPLGACETPTGPGAEEPTALARLTQTASASAIEVDATVAPTVLPPTAAPPTRAAATAAPATAVPTALATTPATTGPAGTDLAVWAEHASLPGSGTVTYGVHYANLSLEQPADGVVVQIVPPEGAGVTRVSRDGDTTPDGLLVPVGPLGPGEAGTVDVDVRWAEPLPPGTWTELVAQVAGETEDPDMTNNTAVDGERVAAANLTLTLEPAPNGPAAVPGAAIEFLLTYTNRARTNAAAATITATLPVGLAFQTARGNLSGDPVVTAGEPGTTVVLPLRPVGGRASGSVTVRAGVDPGLAPGTVLTTTTEIATPGELDLSTNAVTLPTPVQSPGPDVWVALDSKGATDLGGEHLYRVRYGALGTLRAEAVTLTLELPAGLEDVTYSLPPTGVAGGTATWALETLAAVQEGRPIEVRGTVAAEGEATARAAIAFSGAGANPTNDTAEVTDTFVALAMPVIAGPSDAVVDASPTFYGTGTPGATVSLYLPAEGSDELSAEIASAVVDAAGDWEATPAAALGPGWHWVLATQSLGYLTSGITGVANYVALDLGADPDSLTVDGERAGGIDVVRDWITGDELRLGVRLTGCAAPLTPTLVMDLFDADDGWANRREIAARSEPVDGYAEFDLTVPRAEQEVSFALGVAYYCREGDETKLQLARLHPARHMAGLWDDISRWFECLFGTCEDPPPPPPPPQPCPGCTPLKKEQLKPKPKFFGPDPDPEDRHFAWLPGWRDVTGRD